MDDIYCLECGEPARQEVREKLLLELGKNGTGFANEALAHLADTHYLHEEAINVRL